MDNAMKVEFEAITDAVARLGTAEAGIGATLSALDEQVARLRGRWSGEASDAYDRAQQEWTTAIRELNELLAQATASLTAARDGFRAAEDANIARWPV
jgi:WXG100 family type VII secretion target